MKRLQIVLPALLVAALMAWFLFKDTAWQTFHEGGTVRTQQAPDYGNSAAWILRPDIPPPSVWEAGWAVDVFLLPPWPKAWTGPGTIAPDNADYRIEQADFLAAVLPALGSVGPVYSPAARLPAPMEDMPNWTDAQADAMAALEYYFENDNNGRAVALAVPEGSAPLIEALMGRLDRVGHREHARIVALIVLGDGAMAETFAECGFGPSCPTRLPVQPSPAILTRLGAQPAGGVHPLGAVDEAGLSEILSNAHAEWINHLDENVPKPAEPFGAFESIEAAPVFRPGGAPVED